jgi:hypothetical protein
MNKFGFVFFARSIGLIELITHAGFGLGVAVGSLSLCIITRILFYAIGFFDMDVPKFEGFLKRALKYNDNIFLFFIMFVGVFAGFVNLAYIFDNSIVLTNDSYRVAIITCFVFSVTTVATAINE